MPSVDIIFVYNFVAIFRPALETFRISFQRSFYRGQVVQESKGWVNVCANLFNPPKVKKRNYDILRLNAFFLSISFVGTLYKAYSTK